MQIIKEKLEIEETLKKRVKNNLMFLNIKKIQKGNIINIPRTNLAYIGPHKLAIGNITLFFNECENVYINILEKFILLNELENYIKKHKNYKVK